MRILRRVAADTSIAIIIPKYGCSTPNPIVFNLLKVRHPNNAPIIIIPSRAMLITPLLSENIPPSATNINGTANIIVAPNISTNKAIIFAPPLLLLLPFLH